MIGSLARLLLLLGCGWCYTDDPCRTRPVLLRLALAHLTGAAALALGVTFGLVMTDRVLPVAAASGLCLFAVLGLTFRGNRSRSEIRGAALVPPWRPRFPAGKLSVAEYFLLFLIAVGVFTAFARVWLLPLDWDGWAIWQFKARAMADGSLRRLLTDPAYGYAHPDYPLLVPAHTWWLTGSRFDPKFAQWEVLLFFLDLLALFWFETRVRLPRLWALAGTAVLLSWPLTMKHAASGFSDIPLAAYALGAVAALAAYDLRISAALLVGAVLTKNEGLFLFAAALLVSLLPSGVAGERRAGVGRKLLVTVASGGLALGAWSVVKHRWALAADLLDPGKWPAHLLGLVPQRLGVVVRGLIHQVLAVGPRYPGWGVLWPIAGFAAVVAVRRRLAATLPFWTLTAVQLAGAATAYVVTNTDPALHLDRSLDRLLLQVAPATLLATLLTLYSLQTEAPDRSE